MPCSARGTGRREHGGIHLDATARSAEIERAALRAFLANAVANGSSSIRLPLRVADTMMPESAMACLATAMRTVVSVPARSVTVSDSAL